MNTPRSRLFPALLAAIGFASPPCVALELTGPWTPDGPGVVSPDLADLEAFRDYFGDVLSLYDKYEPIAQELAAGVEAAGPFRLSPSIGEQENGFGGDLDTGNVGFNPLATGGTADIASGGNYIDKQINSPSHGIAIARVDNEKQVFRQEFGPVRASRIATPPGGDPGLEWYRFEFRAIDPLGPFPPSTAFGAGVTARLGVVPEPAAALLALLGGLAAFRRR